MEMLSDILSSVMDQIEDSDSMEKHSIMTSYEDEAEEAKEGFYKKGRSTEVSKMVLIQGAERFKRRPTNF